MIDTQFQFTQYFYKLFYIQQQFLDSFAPEPLYLQNLVDILNTHSLEDQSQRTDSLRKYIKHKQSQLSYTAPTELLGGFLNNLDDCQHLIIQDRWQFIQRVESLNLKSYQLRHIVAVQSKIDFINERYSVVLRNIANLRHTYTIENVEANLHLHYKLVLKLIDSKFTIKMTSSREDVSSNGSGYQQRVTEEVRKQRLSIRVPSDEVQTLKHQLFASTDSLATKRRVSKFNIEMKVQVAKSQMRSISELELSIVNMQTQIDDLKDAQSKATETLNKKKGDMSTIILELVRLNSLADILSNEVGKKIKKLQDELEQNMKDSNMSEAEKKQKMDDIKKQMASVKAEHDSDIELLETHKTDLNQRFKESLKGQPDSELVLIEDKVKAMQPRLSDISVEIKENGAVSGKDQEVKTILSTNALQEKSDEVAQVKSPTCLISDENGDYYLDDNGNKVYLTQFFTDEIGRYYLDADGNRVYKANAYAAEYRMIDGKLVKVKDELTLLMDELGDYFLDADGNKVYVQMYEWDEVGRYYIDANGNRVYKSDPYGAEYQIIDGVLTMTKESTLERDSSEDLIAAPKSQFEYVKEHLGKALRRALAATIVHQPNDPINFIANHLLKQRHAELSDVVRQIEEQTIRDERDRVVQEEERIKYNAVLDPCNPCSQFA